MSKAPNILVIDDDRYDNDRYCQLLRSAGHEVQSVTNAEQALHIIGRQRFDVVLLDMLLPIRLQGRLDFGGIEVLRRIKQRDAATQVIAVTGYGSRELAAEAMAGGAFDYITKDLDTEDRLPGIVRVALTRAQLLHEANRPGDEEEEATLNTPNHLIADSEAMRKVLRRAQRLASIDGPLLIVGEPGVGKELIARAIHINSHYASGPFVVVPCRTLSSDLVELWGYISQPKTDTGMHQIDVFSRYEHGLDQLSLRIGKTHKRYSEMLIYQQRLAENIAQSRQYGDADIRKAERSEIINRLNELTLTAVGVSFIELSKQVRNAARHDPVEHAQAGFCAQAEDGTLVLKEIQDLPFNQQKQLVSLVKDRTYQPVGSMKSVNCHLRVIATTTGDLERLVRQGRFWRALYDALSVATLDVPPLRERRDKDDIMAIAGYMLHRYGLASGITPEAAALLVAYDYIQANIKELEDILRAASVQAGGGIIQPEHLPSALHTIKANSAAATAPPTGPDIVELSIRIVPGDSAVLIWESHVGGSSRSRLDLPFAETDLPLLLRALDTAQRPDYPEHAPLFSTDEQARLVRLGLWDGARVIADVERRVGQLLYQALMADPAARSALDGVRNSATDKGQSFALLLRFPPEATALASIPWELLWDDQQPLLLSRGKLSSCVRYIDLPQALPLVPVTGRTLRLLAVRPSKGIPDELYTDEQANLARTLEPLTKAGLLVVEELHPAYKSSLTDRLQDGDSVDILHFYGHGAWIDGAAYLQLDDGMLNANQLAALIGDIPLVVLHACRSATVGANDLFTGIAPMLSAEGVAMVVAMQFTVSVEAANRFAVVFYRNLAKGESLQTAVVKARQALYAEYRQSWYVPVVYIRSRDLRPMFLIRK
jgi:DNA-binding NtrC family response regulator